MHGFDDPEFDVPVETLDPTSPKYAPPQDAKAPPRKIKGPPVSRKLTDAEMPRPLPVFALRPMLQPDLNLVLRDWMTHYRKQMYKTPDRVYYVGMQKRIARHARKAKMLIAVDVDEKAAAEKRDILGWICFNEWDDNCIIVHYVFVKRCFRAQGLGRALMAAAGWRPNTVVVLSGHKCALPRQLQKRYNFHHNPFLLEEILEW